jgi:hypothetical protein
MIGLILIYFIGKSFYKLAEKHKKSEWGFAILGVALFYIGSFVGGFIVGILFEVFSPGTIDGLSDTILGVIGLPFGLITWWFSLKQITKKWETNAVTLDMDVLDDNLME